MTTARPDLGFCISGHALDGHIVAVDAEGPARDAGLVDGDVIVSLDGLSLAEFRASDWWPRPQGKPIKVVYHRRGMIHRGNIVVDVFDEPVAAACAPGASAAAVPEDHTAPDAPAAAENDVAPDMVQGGQR
jgi:predicted metalloprotease with PDZ domain